MGGRGMPIQERACDWCRTRFTPYLGRRDVRWCSQLCKKRAGSAAPRSKPKTCPTCRGSFTPSRSAKQFYCSRPCQTTRRRLSIAADPQRLARKRIADRAYSRTEAYRIGQRSAKARRRAAERKGRLTVADWRAILDRYGHRCAYCRAETDLTMDHIIALARGGAHDPENVVPACGPCNSAKGTADWSDRLVVTPSCP